MERTKFDNVWSHRCLAFCVRISLDDMILHKLNLGHAAAVKMQFFTKRKRYGGLLCVNRRTKSSYN